MRDDRHYIASLIKDPVMRAKYLVDRQKIEDNCARNVAIVQIVFTIIILIAVTWTLFERYI